MSYEAWREPDGRPWPKPAVLPACMGGFKCNVRERCARYHQAERRNDPSDRLCSPNRIEMWVPIEFMIVGQARDKRGDL